MSSYCKKNEWFFFFKNLSSTQPLTLPHFLVEPRHGTKCSVVTLSNQSGIVAGHHFNCQEVQNEKYGNTNLNCKRQVGILSNQSGLVVWQKITELFIAEDIRGDFNKSLNTLDKPLPPFSFEKHFQRPIRPKGWAFTSLIVFKPCHKLGQNLNPQNLDQTSASKYQLNSNFKVLTSITWTIFSGRQWSELGPIKNTATLRTYFLKLLLTPYFYSLKQSYASVSGNLTLLCIRLAPRGPQRHKRESLERGYSYLSMVQYF